MGRYDDAYTWGQRTVCDVDCMSDQMARDQLGDDLPPGDNFDCWPCCPDDGSYLASKGLERFTGYDDMGTKVEPMYDGQTVYKGYGEMRHGYQRK